jgi:hypothetical protein
VAASAFAILKSSMKNISKEANKDYHLKMLTDMLNPEGMHEYDDIVLKLFFEKFLPDKIDIDFSKCKLHREYFSGEGQPDIYINCGDFGIIIENKIWMPEQETQLPRYKEALEEKYGEGKYHLFYLTLDGRESKSGIGKPLSYCKDILSWVELCDKTVCDDPSVNEVLKRYIAHISANAEA